MAILVDLPSDKPKKKLLVDLPEPISKTSPSPLESAIPSVVAGGKEASRAKMEREKPGFIRGTGQQYVSRLLDLLEKYPVGAGAASTFMGSAGRGNIGIADEQSRAHENLPISERKKIAKAVKKEYEASVGERGTASKIAGDLLFDIPGFITMNTLGTPLVKGATGLALKNIPGLAGKATPLLNMLNEVSKSGLAGAPTRTALSALQGAGAAFPYTMFTSGGNIKESASAMPEWAAAGGLLHGAIREAAIPGVKGLLGAGKDVLGLNMPTLGAPTIKSEAMLGKMARSLDNEIARTKSALDVVNSNYESLEKGLPIQDTVEKANQNIFKKHGVSGADGLTNKLNDLIAKRKEIEIPEITETKKPVVTFGSEDDAVLDAIREPKKDGLLQSETGSVATAPEVAKAAKEKGRTALQVARAVVGDKAATQYGPVEESLAAFDRVRVMRARIAEKARLLDRAIVEQFKGVGREARRKAGTLTEAFELNPDGTIRFGARNRALPNPLTFWSEMESSLSKEGQRYVDKFKEDLTPDNLTPEVVDKWLAENIGMISPQLDKVLNKYRWRYDPKTAEQMFNAATDKEKEMALWWARTRNEYKNRLGITSDIEAYLHHDFTNGLKQKINNLLGKPLFSKYEPASFEKFRSGKTGYGTDLKTISRKYISEAEAIIAKKEALSDLEENMYKPWMEGRPLDKGWTLYDPQYSPKLKAMVAENVKAGGSNKVAIPIVTKNYLERIGGDPVFYDVASSEMYNSAKANLRFLGWYWKANILSLATQTAVTNMAGGATQIGSKYMTDAMRLMIDIPFRPKELPADAKVLLRDLWAVPQGAWDTLLALTEKGTGKAPAVRSLSFGGDTARATTELVRPGAKSVADTVFSTLLAPQSWGDDFIKRVILFSQTGPATRRINNAVLDGTATPAELKLWQEAMRQVDRFGFNYETNPEWVNKARNGMVPFISYIYHAGKMTGSMTGIGTQNVSRVGNMMEFRGIPQTSPEAIKMNLELAKKTARGEKLTPEELEWNRDFSFRDQRERWANRLALGTMIMGLAWANEAMINKDKNYEALKSGEVSPDMSMKGRVMFKTKKGGVGGVRAAKYNPYLFASAQGVSALYHVLRKNPRLAGDRAEEMYDTLSNDMLSLGPWPTLGLGMMNIRKPFDARLTRGELAGQVLSSFTPGTRLTSELSQRYEQAQEPTKQRFVYDRPGFMGKLTANIPVVSGKYKGGPKEDWSGEYKTIDPYFKAMSFYSGLNIKTLEKKAVENEIKRQAVMVPDKFRSYLKANYYQPTQKTLNDLMALGQQIMNEYPEGLEPNTTDPSALYKYRKNMYKAITEQYSRVQKNMKSLGGN